MATPTTQTKKYPYPSVFGSHRSMMVRESGDGEHCVCEDEFGEYETELRRLDNGSADPNRYRSSRLGKLYASKNKEGTVK